MVRIKFAPISTEKLIPGTNCSIQVGVIQNNTRSWGVKLTQSGKILTAKRINKLIDVEIVGIIRDTIGKTVAIDTFELGATMSELLREIYDKIKGKKKQEQQEEAVQQPSAPIEQQPKVIQSSSEHAAQSGVVKPSLQMPSIPSVSSGKSDDFWSSYSSVDIEGPTIESQVLPPEPEVIPYQPKQAPLPAASGELDDALAILGIKCPNCGKEVDPELEKCPYCRQPL